MKIKSMKICTHEELATVIMVVYSPAVMKFITSKIQPTKYSDHKNLYISLLQLCNQLQKYCMILY